MIYDSSAFDTVLAALTITGCIAGLAVLTRRQHRPISMRTRHRINQHHEQERP